MLTADKELLVPHNTKENDRLAGKLGVHLKWKTPADEIIEGADAWDTLVPKSSEHPIMGLPLNQIPHCNTVYIVHLNFAFALALYW